MEERDVSGERGEVAESTEQERIQNEEEVYNILMFMLLVTEIHYSCSIARPTADWHNDTSQLYLTFVEATVKAS